MKKINLFIIIFLLILILDSKKQNIVHILDNNKLLKILILALIIVFILDKFYNLCSEEYANVTNKMNCGIQNNRQWNVGTVGINISHILKLEDICDFYGKAPFINSKSLIEDKNKQQCIDNYKQFEWDYEKNNMCDNHFIDNKYGKLSLFTTSDDVTNYIKCDLDTELQFPEKVIIIIYAFAEWKAKYPDTISWRTKYDYIKNKNKINIIPYSIIDVPNLWVGSFKQLIDSHRDINLFPISHDCEKPLEIFNKIAGIRVIDNSKNIYDTSKYFINNNAPQISIPGYCI